ncbi:hypothetical protein SC09_Contig19orf01315 [Bacillus subtilis]|uniref:Uncharacterized protein n=1 Tax=Bacillus subtilis TaxID=1423 RepID=A0A0D1JJN4_BACIU|nr:hypothetical protein SC09_Contig19orf01315 [Bacillus subtilis]
MGDSEFSGKGADNIKAFYHDHAGIHGNCFLKHHFCKLVDAKM